MRKIIIAGNWKMNNTSREAVELVNLLKREIDDITEVDRVVCPPFTALAEVSDLLNESSIGLAAQNLYWEDKGAYTGEISAPMLKACGCAYVIIGHSERRQYFAETDETVNKKIRAALAHDLIPIVCIGERLEEREAGKTFDVIQSQCSGSFADLTADQMSKIIVAYEPVWAIGTGKTATPQQAQEVHQFIRKFFADNYGAELADGLRLQYGGSVKPDNTRDLMSQPDIDGALVGGASLKSESFSAIIKNSCGINK